MDSVIIKFYETLPFKEGLYYHKSSYGIVQPMDLKWYTPLRSSFKYLGIKQHDGMPIDDDRWKDGKWSDKIEFDFND